MQILKRLPLLGVGYKFPCTLCGSVHWPRENTTCPPCYSPADETETETETET